jgi:hypothetical protein
MDRIKAWWQNMSGKRGGTDSVKEDAQEVKDITTSDTSATGKTKDAAEAIKDPGAPGDDGPPST